MINTAKLLNRWTVVASLAILAACGGGGYGGGGGSPPPTGTNDTIVATASPTGVISVAVGSKGAFSVTFTTDDGKTATNLSITSGLSTLPAGWSGPTSFTCASVSTGNGCMVNLTYKPTAVSSSNVVTFNYSYVNNAGTNKTGTATVSYEATSNDSVVATPSPKGQIAVVTGSTRPVGITFTTDDGAMATNLSITSGLSTLPAGWSGPTSFTCASVSTGSVCVLKVTYAPLTFASGTLALSYAYKNNAGTAKTGLINIPYTATTHNNLVEAQSPGAPISAVVNSGSVPVTLTFTTDDHNPATAITITSGLSTLSASHPGWSGPTTFSCASASTGTGCQLALKYVPTVNGSGTVALGYSYNDDSGTAKTGTANIAYASIPGFLYITDVTSNVVRCAVSGVDGSLSACAKTASGFIKPYGIAFSGNWAYVTPGKVATDVDVCAVASDGTLSACKSAQTFGSPSALAVSGGQLYVADANGPGNAYSCPINNADGSLPTCTTTAVGAVNTLDGIAVTGTNAYLVDLNGGNVSTCTVSPTDGSLSACTQQTLNNTAPGNGNTPTAAPQSASVFGGNLYIGTIAGPMLLTIAGDGTVTPIVGPPKFCTVYVIPPPVISSCTIDGAASSPTQTPLNGLAFNNGYGYVSGYGHSGGIGVCKIEASGILDNCVNSTDPGLTGSYGGLAVH